MPTLYERFNTGDDDAPSFYNTQWEAQTFTPVASHTITSVKLLLYKFGSPGTATISITATSAGGTPSGGDLISGVTNANTLGTGTAGEWREITFGDGTALSANTKYSIVAKAAGGTTNNEVYWRWKIAGGYSGGNGVSKTGANLWIAEPSDFMFEDWATVGFIPKIIVM